MPCDAKFLNDQSRRYVRELTEVLALLDLGRLKEFYRKWAEIMELPPMPDDRKLEEDMHMMILELPGLEHLHQSSQQWLQARGFSVEIRDNCCAKAGGPGRGEQTSPSAKGECCGKSHDPEAGRKTD